MRSFAFLPIWLGLLVACGDEGNGTTSETGDPDSRQPELPGNLPNLSTDPAPPIDAPNSVPAYCDFLRLDDCFEGAKDQLMACMGEGRVGVLHEDRTGCEFEQTRAVAEFTRPFPTSTALAFELGFELTVDGTWCSSYAETLSHVSGGSDFIELRTKDYVVSIAPGYERSYACNGEQHALTGPEEHECQLLTAFEGLTLQKESTVSSASVRIARLGGVSSNVFTCRTPD